MERWAVAPKRPRRVPTPVRLAVIVVGATVLGTFGVIERALEGGPLARKGVWVAIVCALVLAGLTTLRRRVRPVAYAAMLAGSTVVAAGAAHETLGTTSVLLVAIATVGAVAGLGGGRAWTRRDPLVGPVIGLAIAPVVVGQILWRQGGGVAVVAVVLALSLLVAEGVDRWPDTVGAADHRIDRAVVWIVTAVAKVVVLVVALVFLYLPGLVARIGAAALRRTRWLAGGWRPVVHEVVQQRRDSTLPFATVSASSRRRQLLGGGVVAVLSVALLASTLQGGDPKAPAGPSTAPTASGATANTSTAMARPYSARPAGAGYPWIDEVQREQRTLVHLRPGPVAGYTLDDLSSRYTNIVHGERVTVAPKACACPTLRVWMVGGSALFGIGQRDQGTLASRLVAHAATDGVRLKVDNMGVPGWTLWQEYQGVLAKLARGVPAPDLIIFYDGFNDMANTFVQLIADGPDWDAPVAFSGGALEALGDFSNRDVDTALAKLGGTDRFAARASTRFADLQRLVVGLLVGQGISTHAFFQPDALTGTVQVGKPLPAYMFPSIEPRILAPLVAALERASQGAADQGYNLRHLFDDAGIGDFFDIAHMNEAGTDRIAGAVYQMLRPEIISAAHA